jgi:GT2 family glycosyltransferase
MERAPLVSVIIVNLNGERYLGQCLSSVFKTTQCSFEVVLVDNGSTDQSLDFTEKTFGSDERLKIIRNSENLGFSEGNNVGFKHAQGRYIAFLNNDTLVDPHWLHNLVGVMEMDRTIGLAQSMLLTMNGQEIQSAGSLYSDYLILQSALAESESPNAKFAPFFEVSFAQGAAMIIERELVEKIGLFEPQAPLFYDDTLLSLKTWIAGRRVVTVSKSKVWHVGGASIGRNAQLITYNISKARICMIFDVYYKLPSLLRALFVFTVSLLSNSLLHTHTRYYSVESKNSQVITGNIHAICWSLRNLRLIWSNRLRHWREAKVTPELLVTKFIRMRIPTALYFLPSSILALARASEASKYRNRLANPELDLDYGDCVHRDIVWRSNA